MAISGWVLTCFSAHSWQLYRDVPSGIRATGTMTRYSSRSHYPDTEFGLVVVFHHSTNISVILGGDMMYEMRRRKPESTLLLTQGIFNLPDHIGII